MKLPPVQYARAADGGRVAFQQAGKGPPVLFFGMGRFCNVAREWETPQFDNFYQLMSQQARLIRFDQRGFASSSAFPAEKTYSEWMLEDVDSVLDALAISQVALVALGAYAQQALEYACTRANRVARIVLWDPMCHAYSTSTLAGPAREFAEPRRENSGRNKPDSRPGVPSYPTPEFARAAVTLVRTSGSVAVYAKCEERNATINLDPFLPQVNQPTFVVSTDWFLLAA